MVNWGWRMSPLNCARAIWCDNTRALHFYSHAGTHMDVPFHFEVNDRTIDEFDVTRFVSDSLVIPIDAHAGQKIKLADLGVYADLIDKGDGVILETGWSAYVNENKYREQLSGIYESLAHWFVGRGLNLIAVETPSMPDVMDMEQVTKIHEILLDAVDLGACAGPPGVDRRSVRSAPGSDALCLYCGSRTCYLGARNRANSETPRGREFRYLNGCHKSLQRLQSEKP